MWSLLKSVVPQSQRAYVASHPLGALLSMGIALSGWVNIVFPHISSETSSAITFSPIVLLAFNLSWAVGGSLSAFGLLRGKPKVEGAGMSLLASALLAYYLAILSLRLSVALSACFILALGIGCALRAWHLATHGYVNLDVRLDQPKVKP